MCFSFVSQFLYSLITFLLRFVTMRFCPAVNRVDANTYPVLRSLCRQLSPVQFQSVGLALIAGVLNTMPQIRFPHPVGKIVVAIGLDDDIGDFSSVGLFCREVTMPAIDDFVVLIYLNRWQRVEDVGVLRDQIVVALAEPGVQVIPEYDVVEGRSVVG